MVTHPHQHALEAAARAIAAQWALGDKDLATFTPHALARAAVTAYLAEAGDGRLSELERENARLREALKPFAEKAGDYLYEDPAHHGIVLISDLRRAALAGSEKP